MMKNIMNVKDWNQTAKVIVGTIIGVVGISVAMLNIMLLTSMIYRLSLL